MGLKAGPAGLPDRVRPGAGCPPTNSGDTNPFSTFAIPDVSSFVSIAGAPFDFAQGKPENDQRVAGTGAPRYKGSGDST